MPTTIPAGFSRLKANLEISGLQTSTVSVRQRNARANVTKEIDVIDDFLTGSYMRNSMIAPLKEADVDVFIVLNPTYWSADGYAWLLDKVRGVLKKSYSEATDISRNGQAVTIKFSDFSMDVVPGFLRQGGGYLIPDSRGKRWIPTDPKKHVEIWSRHNAVHNQDLVPLIKMLKSWNKTHSKLIRSFHLEVLALRIFENVTISDFPSGARYFFDKARSWIGAPVVDPAGHGDNIGRYLLERSAHDDVRDRLQKAYDRAVEAERLASVGLVESAYAKWRTIFSDYFPAFG